MTKLDGNERWKTKMILTGHADQYDQGINAEVAGNKMLTVEERTMIRDLILLPYIDTMVSKGLKELELSGNVLRRAYATAGRYIQKRIIQDVYNLRRELKQRDIKVVEESQDDFITYNIIYCRGYQEHFGLTRDVMRTEISLRLTRYTADLGEVLRDHQ